MYKVGGWWCFIADEVFELNTRSVFFFCGKSETPQTSKDDIYLSIGSGKDCIYSLPQKGFQRGSHWNGFTVNRGTVMLVLYSNIRHQLHACSWVKVKAALHGVSSITLASESYRRNVTLTSCFASIDGHNKCLAT